MEFNWIIALSGLGVIVAGIAVFFLVFFYRNRKGETTPTAEADDQPRMIYSPGGFFEPLSVSVAKDIPEESPPDMNAQETMLMEEIKPNAKLHRTVMSWVFGAYGALILLTVLTWFVILGEILSLQFNLGFWFLVPIILHVFSSIKKVSPNEVAYFYFYGIALKKAGPGLHFVPQGIMNLERGPRDLQEFYMPDHPNKVDWTEEKLPAPLGMTKPVFMNTSVMVSKKVGGQAQMSIGVVWFVFWRIKDLPTFLANVGTIGEANSQLQKISTTVLSEDIAKLDIDSVVSKLADLNAHLDDHIRLRSKNWGIEVMEAGIVKINPSHDYAKAQRDAAMAPFLATARVTAAKAEATERVLFGEADGKASAARASGPLLGRAEGLAKIKEELGVTGSEVLGAETARDAMNNAEWGVLGASSGVADLLGLVKAGSEALKGPGNQPKK